MPIHNRIAYPVEQIRNWIAAGDTQQVIADRLAKSLDPRVTPKLIYKVCKKHGIECQRTGPRAAEGHPEWSGGRIVTRHGYIKLYCPEHPKCVRVNENRAKKFPDRYWPKDKYVWEHRLVMEKHLGRYLKPNEVIHHINGIRDDNRLENLIVFQSNAEHLAHDLKGKCPKWSEEGVKRIRAAVAQRVARDRALKELGGPAQQRKKTQLKE